MYQNTEAIIRPDLQAVVVEAMEADKKFIAQRVFPVWGSATQTGDYTRIKKGSGGLLEMSSSDALLRAPRTPYKEVDRTYEKDGYNCRDRGLTEVVDDSTQNDLLRFFDAEATSTRLTLGNVLRAYEKRVADQVFKPSMWGAEDAILAYTGDNWETAPIVRDFKNAIRKVSKRGELANVAVMSEELWDYVSISTSILKFIFGPNAGTSLVTPEIFAAKFGLAEIVVGRATYSSAKKGAKVEDTDLNYIWNNDYIWIGSVMEGPPEAGGAGRSIYWEEDADFLYVVETYRDEARRSDVVRVRQNSDEKIVNECAGTLITTGFVAPEE